MWAEDYDHLVELPEGLWCSLVVHGDFIDPENDDIEDPTEENGYMSIQCGHIMDNGQVCAWTRTYSEKSGLVAVKYVRCEKADDFI